MWLSRRGVLLRRLRNGRSPVINRLMVGGRLLLTGFVMGLLRLLLARVAVRLVHWHRVVVLVAVVRRLWLVLVLGLLWGRLRVRGLRRLHHVACWRRSVLLLVLRLVLRLAWHVRVSSTLGWGHLLVVCAWLLVDLRHLIHAWTTGRS